ncbi:fungal-specific transcription factor domain-containing protein [Trichoderma novae-zelandiae]
MSQNTPPSKGAGLARFACAHCRHKKIKCSRELPKCAACRPWPGECVYHRLSPISQSPQTTTPLNDPTKAPALILPQKTNNVDQRLSRVERALDTLSDAINASLTTSAASRGHSEAPSLSANSDSEAAAYRPRTDEDCAPELTLDDSHSFSYLGEASRHLDLIKNNSSQRRLAEHQAAATALQDLSKSLTTVSIQPPRTDPVSFESLNGYYVPSRAAGYHLISYFLQNAQLADILFITPPDDLLLAVLFDPATVPQKAWIVYVDFILLTLLQHDPSQADTVESLKQNTDRALNDFRIFLEPGEINIQALMLLGCHGEQYASPNLSWMLVGHACRQAQALGLHSIHARRGSYTQQQRQLALFWSLFSVDKSCSLAFGRPMLLPTATYEHVPLPDFQYLLGYHPHRNQPVPTQSGSCASIFGAHFFIQGMQLAKLTGAVLNLLANPGSVADHETLASQLQSWDTTTNDLLLRVFNTESASSTPHQVQEMMIGVRAMRFQYLHILILLLRKAPDSKDRRVQAARDAIILLPDLVSNSSHVYNGLVWQLLYYPFTPFFTLFGHIMDHPSAPSTQQDLDLLTTTATYFNSMKQFGSLPVVSSKLEKTARVFCNLASFVTSGEHGIEDAQDPQSTATATSSVDSATVEMSSDEPTLSADASSAEADFGSYTDAFMVYLRDQDYSAQAGFDNTDIEYLLGCLDSEGPSPRKRKRSFENTMDWFSWDTYYGKD